MEILNFFTKFGALLVKAATDDSEFGDYLFTHPEDISHIRKIYDERKYQIVSVHELENGSSYVDMTTPCDFGNQPYKYGYFILNRP